jgi:hypothetical protein
LTINKYDYEYYLNNLHGKNYGTKMRRRDPIQFDVGYKEYQRARYDEEYRKMKKLVLLRE